MNDAHRLSIAPMMDRTDRHFRYLARLLAPRTRLYTEMITARALLHGDAERLLERAPGEQPVALQLGGGEPDELARAARLGAAHGYDEVNLNVGCPSGRVQAGCFGAALMLEPERVADCVAAMRAAVDVPVTVKTRLGVDDRDSYEYLHGFVALLADAGCRTVIVHARKAWLCGLSPKENREIPPLDYGRVHRLKRDFPELTVVLNGGLGSAADCERELVHVDGVMLGRAAYRDPWLVAALDARLLGGAARPRDAARAEPAPADTPAAGAAARVPPALENARAVFDAYVEHVERELARGTPLKVMTRHLLGLGAGRPGGRRFRRELTELGDGAAAFARLREVLERCAARFAAHDARAALAA